MARRQNVRDRIGMAVYEKKKLNKKLVTMQKSFQEVKHLIAERLRFSAGSQQIFTLHQCFVP